MRWRLLYLMLIVIGGLGCKKNKTDIGGGDIPEAPINAAIPVFANVGITTDQAVYNPGDEVIFHTNSSSFMEGTKVRYKFLNRVLAEADVNSNTWKWKTPDQDYKGYTAEVYALKGTAETIYCTIAVDVSSNWSKFPRYGFVSKFPEMNEAEVEGVVSNLNRYHLNGLQFYDWQNKHHMPVPYLGGEPTYQWKDIINRDIYFSTVQKYINSAHRYNMKTMFYNLIYGTWDSGEADGVAKEWYVYTDAKHSNKDFHPLSAPFLSNIYLVNPSNTSWQQYLKNENRKVYEALNFDGFHMDQLGDRGTRYTYDGTFLNLADTYKPFIEAIKSGQQSKDLVMNAVSQYGQKGIAESSVNFLYTEVWDPYINYTDLAYLIKANNIYSGNTKNTVLAAYMNYDLANNKGFFNTASVLMTNAVIFAFGGAHMEMGEHMLGKEYFPNNNLEMRDDLKKAMVAYYDFLVSYQNLLRDGGTFNDVPLSSADGKLNPIPWSNTTGATLVVAKKVGSSQVIHLLNFNNAKTTNWRDNAGVQPVPAKINDAQLSFSADGTVKKMWYASPDVLGAASLPLNFKQNGNKVSFTLPVLQYWSMVVVEY